MKRRHRNLGGSHQVEVVLSSHVEVRGVGRKETRVEHGLLSNQHWREGCPHADLRGGTFEWLQLLTHPEIWVYPGATMGESMRSMLDAKREEWLGHLANDRIDLA